MVDFIKIAIAGVFDTIYGVILAAFYPVFSALGHPEFIVLMFILFTVVPILVTYSQLLSVDLDNPILYLQIIFTLAVELGSIVQIGWLIIVGAILNIIAPIIGSLLDNE
jgi:hypothetical protein